MRVLDDALIEEISASPDPERWLILDRHPAYQGFWKVQALGTQYLYDFNDLIGPHKVISPAEIDELLSSAEEQGYQVVFGEDPLTILDAYRDLDAPPPISINSKLPGTTNGLLPYQIQGFNKLKDVDGSALQWTTGAGKTVGAIAWLKYHILQDNFDFAFFAVKANNKINTARWLEKLGNLESIVVDGDRKQRDRLYDAAYQMMEAGQHPIIVTNYEKFRDDFCTWSGPNPQLSDWGELLFKRRIACVWDEMPTKLKNRTSKLYKAVVKCLYRTSPPAVNWQQLRPVELRQIMLSATPVEVSPEDWFNCARILDGGRTYGSVKDFRDRYAAGYDHFDPNKVTAWRDIDDIALRAAHMVHRVDKSHPDIAAQFPEVIEETVYIDWDEKDRKIYDKLTKEMVKKVTEEDEEEGGVNIFAAIGVMQMLCDAPTMVNDSAALRESWEELEEDIPPAGSKAALALVRALGAALTNDRHTKIAAMREIITERHPDAKVLVYTTFSNRLLPLMGEWLDDWGVTYVTYGGSNIQKQEAEDRFREDPDVRVFLSSDKGSDSLNLEIAQVGINYDLPWNWSRRTQRIGRNDRRTSGFDTVYWYDLIMANSIEDRKLDLISRKKAYHDGITGRASAEAVSARLTSGDLLAILGG